MSDKPNRRKSLQHNQVNNQQLSQTKNQQVSHYENQRLRHKVNKPSHVDIPHLDRRGDSHMHNLQKISHMAKNQFNLVSPHKISSESHQLNRESSLKLNQVLNKLAKVNKVLSKLPSLNQLLKLRLSLNQVLKIQLSLIQVLKNKFNLDQVLKPRISLNLVLKTRLNRNQVLHKQVNRIKNQLSRLSPQRSTTLLNLTMNHIKIRDLMRRKTLGKFKRQEVGNQ